MTVRGWAGAAATVALLLTGCGSSGSDDEGTGDAAGSASSSPTSGSPTYDPAEQRRKDATANLTDFFSVYAPMDGTYFTRKEAGCIAERVVREPGIKRLQKVGVLNDELQYVIDADPRFSASDARAVTAALFGCSRADDRLRRKAIADIDGATPAQRACAAEKLDDELLAALFARALQDKPLDPAVRQVAEAFAPCRDA